MAGLLLALPGAADAQTRAQNSGPSYDPLEQLFTASTPPALRLGIVPQIGGVALPPAAQGAMRPGSFGLDEALTSQSRYERSWLLSRPEPQRSDAAWRCLKEAIYHEARGESLYGQFAVAEVILNRVDASNYPDDVCGVVNQNAHRRNACQFSFACNGRTRAMGDRQARALAGRIADLMLRGAERELTDGATHFHTTRVSPSWSRRLVRTARIGAHIFYRQPVELSSN